MSYQNVVVGTDGSETAEKAVRHAARLAASHGARLVIVTAYEPEGDELATAERSAPEDMRWLLTDRTQADDRAQRGRTLARAEGVGEVVVQAVAGSPTDVLLETAADFAADVLVVGSLGLSGAARLVLGSVASGVAHHAPCDVLIVHTSG